MIRLLPPKNLRDFHDIVAIHLPLHPITSLKFGWFYLTKSAKRLVELHPAATGRMRPGDMAAQFVPVQVLERKFHGSFMRKTMIFGDILLQGLVNHHFHCIKGLYNIDKP